MPTLPLHQSCPAAQVRISSVSAISSAVYSSVATPSEAPVPRTSTRTPANPFPAKIGIGTPVIGEEVLVLAIRDRLHHRWKGPVPEAIGKVEGHSHADTIAHRHEDPAIDPNRIGISVWHEAVRRVGERSSPIAAWFRRIPN